MNNPDIRPKLKDMLDALYKWKEANGGHPDIVRLKSFPTDIGGLVEHSSGQSLYGMEVQYDSSLKDGEFAFEKLPDNPDTEGRQNE